MLQAKSLEPLTISQKEFAKRLGVGENNVRAAVRDGRIYALKMGSRVCIPVSELERLTNRPRFSNNVFTKDK